MADKRDRNGSAAIPMAAIFAGGVAARNLAAQGENRPQKALELAARLKRKGASPQTIHAETSKLLAGSPYAGVHYGADGLPRFEISDEAARVRKSSLNKAGQGYVGDFVQHPELYKAYPESQLLGVEKANFRGGGYDGQKIHIGDNHFARSMLAGRPVARDSARGVALHELQHYAQETEGFAAGASPDDFKGRFPGESNRALREHIYQTTAGEVEAENARARRNLTAEQRRATAPSNTETVPVSEQHLGPYEGRARTGEVRRVQRMVEKSPSSGRKPRASKAKTPKIKDLGEKIGGARKDTAHKTGPRKPRSSAKAQADADPRPAWARRYTIMDELDRATGKPTGTYSIADTAKKSRWGVSAIARGLKSRAEAEAMIPMAAVSRNHRVYSGPEGKGFAIWRNVTDRKRVQIGTDTFPTREAAMEYMAKNAVKIIETKTGFGEEILAPPKPDQVFRTGPAVRKGNIKGSQFMKEFGFRGVEFGNWNNQIERQRVMNHAYDALRDLSEVTGLHPKAMSLDGKLGLAFGARGQGLSGARAHYERNYATINLTKMQGAGSLAHEWMHALDHYLGRQDDPNLDVMVEKGGNKVFDAQGRSDDYISHRVAGYARTQKLAENVRTSMKGLMDSMYYKEQQFVEDVAKVEKFTGAMEESVKERLDAIRKNLTEKQTYGKRFVKPATAEQLAEFDKHAKAILEGDTATKWIDDPTSKRRWGRGRHSNDSLEGISKVLKAVRGRNGFDSQHHRGTLDYLRSDMSRLAARQQQVAEAAAQTVKTRKIPTDFAMNAKRIDQGRVQDYWTTRHEMAARGFSSFVEDKIKALGRESGFLSYGSNNNRLTFRMLGVKPFPEGAERAAINAQFETLFTAIRKAGVLPEGSAPAAAAIATETSGLRGTQNAANLAAILENRRANAQPEVKAPAEARGVAAPGEAKPGLVGREWDSPYGRQRIARVIQHPTGEMVEVETVGSQAVRRYDAKRIDETIAKDVHRTTPAYQKERAEQAEMQKMRAESQARQEAAAAKVREEVKGFTDAKKMSPMAAKKAENALLRQVRSNGNIVKTKDLVERRVAEGMRVETITIKGKAKRVLAEPGGDGAFIELNKTALDYAEHVVRQQAEQKPNTIKGKQRFVTLGNGQKVTLGQYTSAWKTARAMNPETGVRGTPSDPSGGGTAGDFVREMRAGMHDRINKHDPQFGKGRKWDDTWQRDARNLKDTLARRSEVPAGQAHPVDLRPRLAKLGKLEEGTFVPPKGGDRSQAAQKARNPRYVPGKGVPQEKYWTYKVDEPTPTVAELPKGAFKGSQGDFEKLSPGMRREIQRTAQKLDAKPKVPQVAPIKGMAPLGFQNKDTLNAALKAQGKAAAGKGTSPAPKTRQSGTSATPKAPQSGTKSAPKHEIRAEGRRFNVLENGKPILDSKGNGKWFGTKAKAEAYLAKRATSLGKAVNKAGAVAMVAAPAAAAYLAYQTTRTPAMASDGTIKKGGSRAEALGNAAVAGGATAAVGYGVMKAVGGAIKMAAKVAPRFAPALGPVGIVAGVGMMGYGAYQGYQRHGAKGLIAGAIGADAFFDAPKAPSQPAQGRLTGEQKSQFETANAAYTAMKTEAAGSSTKAGGWSDEARIAAYISRMSHSGQTPENLPYGGAPRQAKPRSK